MITMWLNETDRPSSESGRTSENVVQKKEMMLKRRFDLKKINCR